MYGLYRAWFGNGDETRPSLESLSPPDTLVRVGNEGQHQFVAHRGVLAAHSGYLKALLATAATSGHEEITNSSSAVTSVSVSSVGGEAFAPLLDYMYTGHLDVSPDNIYSVLLATHLLHMPGALEQCRGALLRLRGPPPPPPPPPSRLPSSSQTEISPGTILRPVPSRPVGSTICWSQQPSLYPSPHLGLSHLADLRLSSGLGVLSNPGIIRDPSATALTYSFRDGGRTSPSRSIAPGGAENSEIRTNIPRISPISSARCLPDERERWTPDEPKDGRKDARSNEEQEGEEERKNDEEDGKKAKEASGQRGKVEKACTSSSKDRNSGRTRAVAEAKSPRSKNSEASGASASSSMAMPGTSTGNSVVYDVACCDGPVRFHRVLNENYVSTGPAVAACSANSRRVARSCEPRSDEESDETRRVASENDENGKPGINEEHPVVSGATSGPAAVYTCGYCRHTFKSQYCYRKHARRHLLPSSETETSYSRTNESPNRRQDHTRRREVKPLDLNVQYYPCKICGSKFPSYYFVHKHRKLCHANVDDGVANNADGEANVPRGTNESIDP